MAINNEEMAKGQRQERPKPNSGSSVGNDDKRRTSFLGGIRDKLQRDWIEQHGFNPYTRDKRLGRYDKVAENVAAGEAALERHGIKREDRLDAVEENDSLSEDLANIFKFKIAQNGGVFSEIVKVDEKGKLVLVDNGKIGSLFAIQANDPEGLYKLAEKVHKFLPQLQFQFDRDPEGKWVKYSVSLGQENNSGSKWSFIQKVKPELVGAFGKLEDSVAQVDDGVLEKSWSAGIVLIGKKIDAKLNNLNELLRENVHAEIGKVSNDIVMEAINDLDLAVDAIDDKKWRQEVEDARQDLIDFLQNQGIRRLVPALGAKFDASWQMGLRGQGETVSKVQRGAFIDSSGKVIQDAWVEV